MADDSWAVPGGWSLSYRPVTESTNDDARSAAASGCPDRSVFLADLQTRGRGRLGRAWVAPAGACLLFSIVFRKAVSPITLVALCSISVADAVRSLTGLSPRIKWPNDVMLGDRKLAGILAEVVSRGQTRATVVGIGLNVNLDPVAAGLPASAISLSHASGRMWSRPTLLTMILQNIERDYDRDPATLRATVWPRWEALLWRRRQQIRLDAEDRTLIGTVEGLGPSGTLIVREDSGNAVEVTVGDISAP